MKISIDKTKMTATMIIFLMLASVSLIALPAVNAAGAGATNQALNGDTYAYTLAQGYQNPQHIYGLPLPAGVTPGVTIPTIAHISLEQNLVGIGQDLLVNMWVSPNMVGLRLHDNYNVVFTKPDGTTDTQIVTSFIGDATGFLDYHPDMAGTWSVMFTFPGDYFPAGNYTTPIGTFVTVGTTEQFLQSTYYAPCYDGPYNFTVQSNYVYTWPAAPLPTDYWTRPISLMNRNWDVISGWYPATGVYGGADPYPGNWPAGTNLYMSDYNYVPYVQGPNSSHILWDQQQGFSAGIIGGPLSQQSGSGGASNPSIIYDGNMYKTVTEYYAGVATTVYQCSDLRTGQIHWERAGLTAPTFVIALNPGPASTVAYATQSSGENVYLGGFQTLGSGSTAVHKLFELSPGTGATSQNITIDPLTTGTYYMDSDYPYFLSIQTIGTGATASYRLVNWTIYGSVTSSVNQGAPSLQVISNVSCAFSSIAATCDFQAGYMVTPYDYPVNTPGSTTIFYNSGVVTQEGLNVYSLITGQLVQNITCNVLNQHFQSSSSLCVDHGRVAVDFDDGRVHCWDCATGTALWTTAYSNSTDLNGWPWDTFYEYGVSSYGGNYIIGTYAGIIAYNWTDGSRSWLYRSQAQASLESPYQNYNPFFTSVMEADGKVYGYSSEHTPSQPITRSWGLHCCNATDGTEIFYLGGGLVNGPIADGYLCATGAYDGYFYVIGKGTSATTVTASPKTSTGSNTILIEGTVLDQSPAQPNTPCVAKASMSQQMEYLHMQQPINGLFNNVTVIGVPVDILAQASDGTYTDLGTVTTNGYYGTFSMAWTPTQPGTYTIVASFHADDSYGSSSAATAVVVGPAPVATATPTPTATPTSNLATATDLMTYIVVAVIIIIIAIAIVGLLLLRKRP